MKAGIRRKRAPKKKETKELLKKKKEKTKRVESAFNEKIKTIFQEKKWVNDILQIKYQNGNFIFNSEDKDVIFQLIFSLKEDEDETLDFLRKNKFINSEDLYWKLDIFKNVDILKYAEENNYFHVAKLFKSGIVCENPRCRQDYVKTINVGPTSGDEASKSVYFCPLCNWSKQMK